MDERYISVLKILSNRRSLRAFIRELNAEQVEDITSSIQELSKERLDQIAQHEEAEKERQQKIEEYIELMRLDGIDVSEFIQVGEEVTKKVARKPRAVTPPKYEYIKEDGSTATWTGQGRTPKAIATAIQNGHSIEEFLINKS